MDRRFFSYLAICQKAGFAITGEDSCQKAIASKKAQLVIIAADASDNTKKKFANKAEYYNVNYVIAGDRDSLSQAIGKENRPTIVITDKGLSDKMLMLLKSNDSEA